MEQETSLSDLLGDEPAIDPVEAAPEPDEPTDGPARGPDGKFTSKQETGVEPQPETDADAGPPPDKLPKEEYGALRAIRDENKGLKQQLEALQQQFQQAQQPKEPPPPPPSIWEDEQGAFQHLGSQITQQASFNAALNTSEMLCRDRFDDFDEKKAKFLTMAQANPAIAQEALADAHPWRKAYQIASNAVKMEELGAVDLTDLETKMREKIMAEMQAGQTPVPQPTAPPSLTGERNVGSRSGPAWSGPPSLSELLR